MPVCIAYIMSCDARVRSGSRLKQTLAQLLGREGKAPTSWRRIILYCRPSSPFSLSMRRSHAVEPTNHETHKPIASTEKTSMKASGPPQMLPTLFLCGGAVAKVLVQNHSEAGRNHR